MRVIKIACIPTTAGTRPFKAATALEAQLSEIFDITRGKDFDWYFRSADHELHFHFYGDRFDEVFGLDTYLILKWHQSWESV
jgi:hypothetical protein